MNIESKCTNSNNQRTNEHGIGATLVNTLFDATFHNQNILIDIQYLRRQKIQNFTQPIMKKKKKKATALFQEKKSMFFFFG